jgi:hypothetical protein
MKVIGHIYQDTAPVPVQTILDDGSVEGLIVDGYHADDEDVTP